MQKSKILMIFAWLFSAAAVAAAIYNAFTGTGFQACAALMTLAIVLQTFYAKNLKDSK